MKALDDIKEMLCDELETIAKRKELTSNSLDIIDTAVDAIKDIYEVKAMEQEYSEGYSQGYYGRMPMYYDNGGSSYARGGGSNTSRGRFTGRGYSGETKDELQRLMDTAKDDREREAIRTALEHIR